MHGTVPALHALTSDVVLADPSFVEHAGAIMRDARDRVAIHLRATHTAARTLLERALELRVIAEETGSWVLVHDRLDLAMVAGVSGAQLTSRSLAIADARRIAPRLVLGASVHGTAEAWMTAQSGATYLVCGPTEGDTTPASAGQQLAAVVEAADGCPVIAVGGITVERVHAAVSAGAAGVAVMRGIWLGDDAARAARRYLAAYDEGFRR